MLQSGKINLSLALTSQVVRDLSVSTDPLAFNLVKTITNGTGPDQATKVFSDKLSFTGATPIDLDLYTPDAATPVGETYLMTRIVALLISNRHATNTLTISAGGTNPWTGLPVPLVIPGGGCIFLYSRLGFTASTTSKLLTLTPSATLDADVIVVGS